MKKILCGMLILLLCGFGFSQETDEDFDFPSFDINDELLDSINTIPEFEDSNDDLFEQSKLEQEEESKRLKEERLTNLFGERRHIGLDIFLKTTPLSKVQNEKSEPGIFGFGIGVQPFRPITINGYMDWTTNVETEKMYVEYYELSVAADVVIKKFVKTGIELGGAFYPTSSEFTLVGGARIGATLLQYDVYVKYKMHMYSNFSEFARSEVQFGLQTWL